MIELFNLHPSPSHPNPNRVMPQVVEIQAVHLEGKGRTGQTMCPDTALCQRKKGLIFFQFSRVFLMGQGWPCLSSIITFAEFVPLVISLKLQPLQASVVSWAALLSSKNPWTISLPGLLIQLVLTSFPYKTSPSQF